MDMILRTGGCYNLMFNFNLMCHFNLMCDFKLMGEEVGRETGAVQNENPRIEEWWESRGATGRIR